MTHGSQKYADAMPKKNNHTGENHVHKCCCFSLDMQKMYHTEKENFDWISLTSPDIFVFH